MIYLYNLTKTEQKDIYVPSASNCFPFHSQHGMKDKNGDLIPKEELEKEGLFLDEKIDLSYERDGEIFQLFINMETREHFYKSIGKVEERPKSKEELQEEKIKELEQAIAELSVQLSNLGGM